MKRILQLPAKIAVLCIRFYQVVLSPIKGSGCCRFTPTCSTYAITAYQRFGFLRGTYLTAWRILRCHPFYRGCLYDPVPEKKRTEN